MTEDRTAMLKERLQVLNPIELIIEDQSHMHAGHEANRQGASHFKVTISSEQFKGLSRVDQQRLVFGAVADIMPSPIHALALVTKAPE